MLKIFPILYSIIKTVIHYLLFSISFFSLNKHKKKSLEHTCLWLVISLLLTTCSGNYTLPENSINLSGRLLIWHPFSGEMEKVFNSAFRDFKRLHPEVQIVSEYVPPNTLPDRFIRESEYGFGPDLIIHLGRLVPKLVKTGQIQPISEKDINLSSYLPTTWPNIHYQGKIYAWPLLYQTRLLCYNQAKTKAITSDPTLTQPPTTLEGLIQRARKGYSVGMVSSFEDTLWGMGIFGAKFFDTQGLIEPKLEGWTKWLKWLKQANNEPNFILQVENQPNFLVSRNRDILHRAFAESQLTYYVCNSYEIADLKKILKEDLRVALLPTNPPHHPTPILYTIVMMFNRNSSPNQSQLAFKLAEFITNPEQQLKAMIKSQTFIPSNQTVKINKKLLPIEAILQKQSETAIAIPLDSLEPLLEISQLGEVLYQKAISGDIPPEKATQELTQFIQKQINQNVNQNDGR